MPACSAPAAIAGLAIRIYDAVDCRAQALGRDGFDALAGSSMFAQLLSGMMMIAVAVIGYRLIFGGVPTTRNAVLWVARIGAVLALTTGWAAYGTLFHRVSFDAPAELASVVLPAAGLGDPYILVGRVQATYDAFVAAGQTASQNDPADAPPPPAGVDAVAAPAVPAVGDDRSLGPLAFSGAGVVLLVTGLGSLLAAKLAGGLLLALGPLFVLALLLDATIALFEGWLRALAVVLLGALGTTAVLSVELDVLAGEMAIATDAGQAAARDPAGIIAIVALFGVVLVVIWFAAGRAAGRIRLPRTIPAVTVAAAAPAPAPSERLPASANVPGGTSAPAVLASSVLRVRTVTEAISRRERGISGGITQVPGATAATAQAGADGHAPLPTAVAPHIPAGRRLNWRQNTA